MLSHSVQFCSVHFSRSVVSDSLQPHESQHAVMSNSLQPHGLYPARLLCPWGFSRQKWVVMPSSRQSSQPRDQTQISGIAGGFFTI